MSDGVVRLWHGHLRREQVSDVWVIAAARRSAAFEMSVCVLGEMAVSIFYVDHRCTDVEQRRRQRQRRQRQRHPHSKTSTGKSASIRRPAPMEGVPALLTRACVPCLCGITFPCLV